MSELHADTITSIFNKLHPPPPLQKKNIDHKIQIKSKNPTWLPIIVLIKIQINLHKKQSFFIKLKQTFS